MCFAMIAKRSWTIEWMTNILIGSYEFIKNNWDTKDTEDTGMISYLFCFSTRWREKGYVAIVNGKSDWTKRSEVRENLRSWQFDRTRTLLALKQTPRLFLPTGEGAPSKSEGVGGAFWRGSRGNFSLVGLGNAQGFNLVERTYWQGNNGVPNANMLVRSLIGTFMFQCTPFSCTINGT